MEGELGTVFEQIEKGKGIPKKDLLLMIELALASAFHKHSGRKQEFEAHIDPDSGTITAYVKKTVVDKVTNPHAQIAKEEAVGISPAAKIGDEVKIEVKTEEFGRIAAQTAKQVIIQRIREKEKENLYKEFKEKEKTLVNGFIHRFVRKDIVMNLGKAEAILPYREQIERDKSVIGQRMKVYILKVENSPRGPRIVVSRTHTGLVKELFVMEIPEVYDHTIEIKHIVRQPGVRCKIALLTHNEKVDPIGACVGMRGSRIQAISDELYGEKMDLIVWSEDPAEFISKSLSPAKVSKVVLDREKKKAYVTVPDDMLSLAIGKGGQNVRLSARLTGWHIDVKSESERKKEDEVKVSDIIAQFTELRGVGEKTAKTLVAYGFKSIEDMSRVSEKDLEGVSGIGPATAKKIYDEARNWMKEKKK